MYRRTLRSHLQNTQNYQIGPIVVDGHAFEAEQNSHLSKNNISEYVVIAQVILNYSKDRLFNIYFSWIPIDRMIY